MPSPYKFYHLDKIRRRRDLNPRAARTAYTLSRGASSANLSTSPCRNRTGYSIVPQAGKMAEGVRFELTAPSRESPVFKTGSLNRSDIPPNRTGYTIRSTLTSATHIFYHISRRLSRGFSKKTEKYYVTISIRFFARLDYAIPRSHFSISATSSSRCIQCSAPGITVISALFSSANLLTVSNGTTSSFSPYRI